jgi:putative ABC transport system permease protein
MPEWKPAIRARLAGSTYDEELVEEIAEHADELYETLRQRGRSDAEAREAVEAEMRNLRVAADAARARRAGRLPAAPEPVRSARRFSPARFGRDLIYGGRVLAARPGFTAVAVLTLALGIGANTAIFSVVHALLLQRLPFPEPERLVMVWETEATNPQNTFIVAAPNWQDWVKESASFEALGLWETLRFNIAGGAEPEQVLGLRMSASTFDVFGVRPQLGRTFTSSEDAPGHSVVVISDGLWRRRFGAQQNVIGSSMRLNGESHEIIGVMPRAFAVVNTEFAVWVPIALNRQDAGRGSHSFMSAGRLKPGVPFETAKAEMETIGNRLAQQYPQTNLDETATITRMDALGVTALRPTLIALQGAVALVLLIACVNVANLLLAQASGRQREFAIRASLGASRGRIASQLLAEGLLLSLLGGLAGIGIAAMATSALSTAAPRGITLAPFRSTTSMSIDTTVLLFTVALSTVTGVLFSFAPMLGIAKLQPASTLKTGDRGGTAPLTTFRAMLVAFEVALAIVVLAAAGLMVKSVMRLMDVQPGLDPTNVAVLDMALPQKDFYGPPVRTTFCADLSRDVGAVPGVASVGAISHLPLSGATAGRGFAIEGRPEPPPQQSPQAAYRVLCPGYFQALSIPILNGRDFSHGDTTDGGLVVIINEATASYYWPGEDPVGRRVKLGGFRSTSPWLTVIGVAGNVRHFGLDTTPRREIYRPYSQAAWPSMTVTVKSATEPASVLSGVRASLARIDRDQPVTRVRSMDTVITESIGARRFPMLLLGAFGGVALLLAAVGVYGVVNYVVSQRTREIGIRMALGARAAQVMRLVVGRSMIPIGVGIGVGIGSAIAASRLLTTMLYEVQPGDPWVIAAIAVLLGTSAVMASVIPARRAAAVDPNVVLKAE